MHMSPEEAALLIDPIKEGQPVYICGGKYVGQCGVIAAGTGPDGVVLSAIEPGMTKIRVRLESNGKLIAYSNDELDKLQFGPQEGQRVYVCGGKYAGQSGRIAAGAGSGGVALPAIEPGMSKVRVRLDGDGKLIAYNKDELDKLQFGKVLQAPAPVQQSYPAQQPCMYPEQRFRVLLRECGMTTPYPEDGAPREIWPDGRFLGYPSPKSALQPDNQDGYRFNSMPLLYLNVTYGVSRVRALFLIDSGADSLVKWSLYLKHEQLRLLGDDDRALTLRLDNDAVDAQPNGQLQWSVEYTAEMRIDKQGRPSPRENSVLGLPWMVQIKPLFEYEGGVPSPAHRLAIRFPSDGKKAYYKINVCNPETGRRFAMPACIDTGAPYSTFPEGYANALGLGAPLKTRSYPDGVKKIFTWFDYEERKLYNVDLCEAEGASVQWRVRNPPPTGVGLTARSKQWGLLGVDFLLAVKPLILYGHEDLPGQVKDVDYHERNLLEEIDEKDAKKLMAKELKSV